MVDTNINRKDLLTETAAVRQQAADALDHGDTTLRAVFDASSSAMFVKDGASHYVLVNRQMAELHGHTPETMEGLSEAEVGGLLGLDDDEVATFAAEDRQVIDSGQPLLRERPYRSVAGETRWYDVRKSPIVLHGESGYVLGVATDVTERHLAEEALEARTRQQEQLFAAVRQVASSLDLSQVLNQVGQAARDMVHAQSGVILTLESDGRTLVPLVALDEKYAQELMASRPSIDHSLTGLAIKSRHGMLFNSPDQEPMAYTLPETDAEGEERVLVAPLLVEGQVLGAMCLNRVGEPFTADDLALAETFAAYAATALRNARSHQALQDEVSERRRIQEVLARRTLQQERLMEAAQQLTASLELDQVLVRIAREAREIADSQTVVIFKLEADGRVLRPLVAMDQTYASELLAGPIDVQGSLTGLAIQSGHGLYFNQPMEQERAHPVPNTPFDPLDRVIVAPLVAEGRAIGALWLNRQGAPYTEEDLALVEVFAAYAAAAMENAGHHQELHRGEQALRGERDRAQRYLDVAGAVILVLDREHRVALVNRYGCDLMGYCEAEIVGQDWIELAVPPANRADVRAYLERIFAGETEILEAHENPLVRRDGSLRQIVWHNSPLSDERGQVIGVLSSGSDITERVLAEEQLQWEMGVTEALSQLYRPLVGPEATVQGIAEAVLGQALALSGSRYGYVTSIDPKTGDNLVHTMSDLVKAECRLTTDSAHLILPAEPDGSFPGLWGYALNDGRSFFTNAPAQHSASAGLPAGHLAVHRFLSVPVRLGAETVGQISLANAERDYRPRDLEAVERLAEYYALAIQRIRNERALETKTQQQQQLIETAQRLNQSLDLMQVLHDIGEGAKSILRAFGCAIYRLEPDGRTLTPLVSLEPPFDAEVLATPLSVDDSCTGQAVRAGHGLIFNQYSLETAGQVIPGTPDSPDERIIAAPFVADGVTLGAMCLSRTGQDFDQDDLALAETFAAYAAGAIKNAQTHETLLAAQQALVNSEWRFRGVAENSQDGLVIMERDRVVYVNDRLQEIIGLVPQGPEQLALAELVAPEDRERFAALRQGLVGSAYQPAEIEMRILRPDGAQRAVLARFSAVFGQGDREGRFIVLTDITDRLVAEGALRASEARYRTVVESINDIIFTLDTDGIISYISPVVERLVGVGPQHFVSQSVHDLVLPEDRAAMGQYFAEVMAGSQESFTFRIRRSDGEVRTWRASSRLLQGDEGRPPTITGRITDITTELRMEERLRQAQKMETVGRLAGGVAHDFNNLLTVINGFSEMLLTSLPAGEEVYLDVEQIHQAGTRAADLVRRLLAFSRQQAVVPKVLDLNQLIGGLARMLPRIIGEDIRLELDLCAEQPLVRADQGQIEQLIINMAANGRDAINELGIAGGRVSISTSNHYLAEGFVCTHLRPGVGPYVCLAICDNGVGMDEQVQQHMFEPFYTTKDVDKGTGLGLAMVYGIVEEMGGCIDLASSRGQGTCFRILLPVAGTGPSATVPAERPASAERGEGLIVVIEDQDAVRLFAGQMLEHLGYSVLTYAHPSEALTLLQSEVRLKPELLLVDVIMPAMSGPELVQRLRPQHADLRVLYMSGHADAALRHQTGLQPGDALLVKPFTLVELARQVKEVLNA